jgi:hypothetical protein
MRENLEEDDFNEIRLNMPEVLQTFSFGNESSIFTIIEEKKEEGEIQIKHVMFRKTK